MKADRPSLTARGVALTRSRMSRPQTPDGDPDAEDRLYAGLQAAGRRSLIPFRLGGRGEGRIETRTRFFDREVLDALTAGVTQVVIVGAGYDGRALRFRQGGVRFFEVDHPATQTDKRQRVAALGVPLDELTFVTVDLMEAGVDPALAAAGHQTDEPSLFICEGLLLYLSPAVVEQLLDDLRTRAAPGSRLAISIRERLPGTSSMPSPRDVWRRVLLAAIGEPRRSAYGLGDVGRLLERTGWSVTRETHRDEPRTGRRGLLLVAEPR